MRILFLDLDTLRPDHLACYGYHRNTSPHIDRIAAQGIRFENYYCADAPCLPSRAALATGRFGIHTGVVNHGGTNADLRPEGPARGFNDRLQRGYGLWSMLRSTGLWTASISPFASRHGAWWFNAGFREFVDPGKGGGESAEEITPFVLDWIRRNAARDNWLLHVNYWDPHASYRAPAEFGNPFRDDPLPAWLTPAVVAGFRKVVGGHSPWDLDMFGDADNNRWPRYPSRAIDMDGVRQLIDGYDCGIRYMDQHIGLLLEELDRQKALDDLVIIVTSDHGECLGELGCAAEHGTADYITCRIPMIIRWPGKARAGQVDTGLHYNLDLLPTLTEMLNGKAPPVWDGRSFAPAILAQQPCGHDHLVLSQCCHGCQRSVRFDDWLHIRTWHDFYHLYPEEMLFNVKDDPHEQANLATQRPDLCRHATELYRQWHARMMATMENGAEDPLDTVLREGGPFHSRGYLAQYCERLKATGRGWAVPELRRRHPGEFRRSTTDDADNTDKKM